MSGFSTFLARAVANHFFLQTAQPASEGTFVALFSADPEDSNIIDNEISGEWYAREEVETWTAPAEDADSSWIANAANVRFSAVTGSSVMVTYYGIYDALTGGNLLTSSALTIPKTLGVDDFFEAQAGDLILRFK